MELNLQDHKTTAMKIPIPESNPKFFDQLPTLDLKGLLYTASPVLPLLV